MNKQNAKEQRLYLHTKTEEDSILTTNHMLETLKQNTNIIYPKNINRGMTAKEHDFMTYVFKALQVFVNQVNKIEVNGVQFLDMTLDERLEYLAEHEEARFLKLDADDVFKFFGRTNTGKSRYVSTKDLLEYLRKIHDLTNNMVLATVEETPEGTKTSIATLFPYISSFKGNQEGREVDVETFDLYINPYAYTNILQLFTGGKGYGSTNISRLELFRTANAKNLWYYVSRYVNLIDSKTGLKVKLKTLTDFLGISDSKRPYKELCQIAKAFNKITGKYGVELTLEPVKRGKNIYYVILKAPGLKVLTGYKEQPKMEEPKQEEPGEDLVF